MRRLLGLCDEHVRHAQRDHCDQHKHKPLRQMRSIVLGVFAGSIDLVLPWCRREPSLTGTSSKHSFGTTRGTTCAHRITSCTLFSVAHVCQHDWRGAMKGGLPYVLPDTSTRTHFSTCVRLAIGWRHGPSLQKLQTTEKDQISVGSIVQ